MKLLILLGFLLTPTFATAQNVCRYDHTTYHAGDRFLDDEQCNSCVCANDRPGYPLSIRCTEMGCMGPRPTQDFRPFNESTSIICQKINREQGYIWEIKLEDLNRNGHYVLSATRNGQIYYSRNDANHYLVVKKVRYRNSLRFYSPAGTVFVDLTRPYGGEVATAYFSTQRFGKQVSNLTCKTF